MRNKDLIEQERREAQERESRDQAEKEARLMAESIAKVCSIKTGGKKPESSTQPEDNGGDGRTFTQAEVNRIIADRLARERSKQEPTAEEQRARELDARENRLKCREYLDQHQLIPDILDLFSTDDYEAFVQSVELLESIMARVSELRQKGGEPPAGIAAPSGPLRAIFGLS